MNPIIAAIMATLEAQLTSTAYQQLKATLTQKFGVNSDVVKAVAALEAKPTSFVRREQLAAELQATHAHEDKALLALAEAMQTELQTSQHARQFVAAFIHQADNIELPQKEEAAPVRDYAAEFSQAFLLPDTPPLLPATIPTVVQSTPAPVKVTKIEAELDEEEDDLPPADDSELRLSLQAISRPPSQATQPTKPTRVIKPPLTTVPKNSPELTAKNSLELPAAPKLVNIYTTVPSAPPVDLTLLDSALYDLAKFPLDTIPDISPLPRGSRMPVEPNPLFRGRNPELRTIARQLKTNKLVIITQVETTLLSKKPQLTSEFGGMGKTHLASEFAHRYGQYFAGGVFWLNFADPASIPIEIIASGGAAASQLRSDFRNMLLEEQMQLVLSAWQSPLPRLLIFDNCEDPELLARWRPMKGGCHVLVTSRNTDWSEFPQATELRLDVLSELESIALLRQYRPDPMAADNDMAGIATELGYLPLALHLAGSFLISYRNDVTPTRYLKRLRKFNIAKYPALKAMSENFTEHDNHLMRAFMLSYEQLDTSDPNDVLAQAMLLRAAFFAPNVVIPRDLLLSTLHHGSSRHQRRDFWGKLRGFLGSDTTQADILPRAKEALTHLVMLGLLELAQDGALFLHPRLSQLLRVLAKGSGIQSIVQHTLAETSQLLKQSGSPTVLLTWHAHLQMSAEADSEEEINLPGPFGQQMLEQSAQTWERHYYERALAINEQLMGENHPDTAQSLDNLGVLATYQNDMLSARFYYERALAIRLASLGEQHADTARSFNNYGALLAGQGNFNQAKTYYDKALTIRQIALGLHHPDTAQSLNNLGELAYQQEKYPEAQHYFEQALTIYAEVLGPHHPETARSWSNLGATCEAQGNYTAAQTAYETAWEIFRTVMGDYHPDTATVLNNLGSLLDSQGLYQPAAVYYEEALAIREAILGAKHPDTATSLHNLGVLQAHVQQWELATQLIRQALTIRQTVLGAQHPHTAQSQEALATAEAHVQKKWQPQVIKPALRQAA